MYPQQPYHGQHGHHHPQQPAGPSPAGSGARPYQQLPQRSSFPHPPLPASAGHFGGSLAGQLNQGLLNQNLHQHAPPPFSAPPSHNSSVSSTQGLGGFLPIPPVPHAEFHHPHAHGGGGGVLGSLPSFMTGPPPPPGLGIAGASMFPPLLPAPGLFGLPLPVPTHTQTFSHDFTPELDFSPTPYSSGASGSMSPPAMPALSAAPRAPAPALSVKVGWRPPQLPQAKYPGTTPGAGINQRLRKTRLCKTFPDCSRCPFGEACAFAHSREELARNAPAAPPPAPAAEKVSPVVKSTEDVGDGEASNAASPSSEMRHRTEQRADSRPSSSAPDACLMAVPTQTTENSMQTPPSMSSSSMSFSDVVPVQSPGEGEKEQDTQQPDTS